jgi:hypothetical protein
MLKILTVHNKKGRRPWKRGICQLFKKLLELANSYPLQSVSSNFLQKYQFENKDCSQISCHKYAGNSLAKVTNLQIHSSNVLTPPLPHCYFRLRTMGPGRSQERHALVTSPRPLRLRIRIAMGERCPTVATATGPACQ